VDRAAVLGRWAVDRRDTAAGDGARVAGERAEVCRNDRRRARRKGEKEKQEEDEEEEERHGFCSHQSPVVSRQSQSTVLSLSHQSSSNYDDGRRLRDDSD